MIISTMHRVYLLLHRELKESDLSRYKTNLEAQQSFWLTPNAVLVVPRINIGPLMQEVTEGLSEPGKITFVCTGEQIYTTLRKDGVDVETVFDKPRQ